jgi:hypothetical protein
MNHESLTRPRNESEYFYAEIRIAFILGLLFILIYLPLPAQTGTNPPPDPNARAASVQPVGQAPDETTKKIAELVHAGKYAEAQQLTTGLLVAYPDDQRLIKARALIEKLLAPAAPANAGPAGSQLAGNGISAQPASVQLTGMDKVEYNSLIELARQAQQTTDLEQQKASLKQFMERSSVFLQKHPDQMLLWQLRAASALSLNDVTTGHEAGQKLLAAGAADSADPNLQQLLSRLNLKGWLDKRGVDEAKKQALATAEADRSKVEHDKYTFPVRHNDPSGLKGFGHLTINENDAVYEGSDGTMRIPRVKVGVIRVGYDSNSFGIKFYPNHSEHPTFYLTTEADVVSKTASSNLSVSGVGNAVLERWNFVSTDGNKTLKPHSH